jgi:cell wall-associated NlpC family hydrolase
MLYRNQALQAELSCTETRKIPGYHPDKSFLVSISAFALVFLQGCIAPYALSHQVAPDDNPKKTSLTVPADWDYRRHYKIPQQRLFSIIDSLVGTPYKYGGNGPKGMDCSGFVNAVFTELNHARLPRTSYAMSRLGSSVNINNGLPGDLVFFRIGVLSRINHVGIFAGNDRFAHASRKKGVIYSSLKEEYYKKRFAGIRRLF